MSPFDKDADIPKLLDPRLTALPEPVYPINAPSECLVYKTPQLALPLSLMCASPLEFST